MDKTNAQAFFPFFPRICSVGNTGSRVSVVVVFFGDDAVLFWERERERMSVDFTHRGRWGGRGGEGRDAKERKRRKEELTQYPNTVDGNIAERRRVVKMEVFILISFLFLFLGKLPFLLSLLMEMNR